MTVNQFRLSAFGIFTILAIHIGVGVRLGDWYGEYGLWGVLYSTIMYIIPGWVTLVICTFLLYKQEEFGRVSFWMMMLIFYIGGACFSSFQMSMSSTVRISENLVVTILGGPAITVGYCIIRYFYELLGDACDSITGTMKKEWDATDAIFGIIFIIGLFVFFFLAAQIARSLPKKKIPLSPT